MARIHVVIVIPDGPVATYKCHPTMRIGAAEDGIRKDYSLRDGSIKLHGSFDENLDADLTFTQAIQNIGEAIEDLEFCGDTIRSRIGDLKFTFVHGEKEV